MEEVAHDVVIVGAGIAGLATALGLHRLGVRSLVLESSSELRSSGFALVTWRNAWRALDVLGVGDALRAQHVRLDGIITKSVVTGATTAEMPFNVPGQPGYGEVRCLRRNLILEALEQGLPRGTVRLGAKVVSIEENGDGDSVKLLNLADGSTVKAKALVGCDGVNSYVAKWLGLKSPTPAGRSAARAITEFRNGGHGFEHAFHQFNGDGFRSGFIPCDDKNIYWFFTWYPSSKDETETPTKLKQYVLSRITAKLPSKIVGVVNGADPKAILASPLRFRSPLDVIWGSTHRDNVCLAGDAFHAMTPDIGQGGCAALEDGVVLARCLGEAILADDRNMVSEQERIRRAVDKYVKERKWRCFELIVTAYIVGVMQQRDGALMNFIRDKGMSIIMIRRLLGITDYDVGSLCTS